VVTEDVPRLVVKGAPATVAVPGLCFLALRDRSRPNQASATPRPRTSFRL
jgi:hypothetical protein